MSTPFLQLFRAGWDGRSDHLVLQREEQEVRRDLCQDGRVVGEDREGELQLLSLLLYNPILCADVTIEQNHLNGQLLQGTLTTKEVHNFLVSRKRTYAYPLFEAVYAISFEGRPVKTIIDI
jgi:hypothetical protein